MIARALGFLFYTECLLHVRRSQTFFMPLGFYLILMVLFPIAITPDVIALKALFSGCLWIAVLLANLLAIDTMFHADFEEQHMEQCVLSDVPFFLIVLVKLGVAWLVTSLPLILVTPLLGVLFQIPLTHILVNMGALMLGTPIILCIGSLGSALTLQLKQQSILLGIMVLPLTIPVLIFWN